jgi:hypothetical protein
VPPDFVCYFEQRLKASPAAFSGQSSARRNQRYEMAIRECDIRREDQKPMRRRRTTRVSLFVKFEPSDLIGHLSQI